MIPEPAPVSRRADGWSLLALAVACVALRAPGLRAGDLNPDESAYLASASYLLGSGKSAFSLFNLAPTLAVYELAARAFSPYEMLPLRVLTLLICFAMAGILYRVVSRSASPWAGLASGLVFVHLAQFFEGATANREWLASPLLLAGIAGAWAARDRARAARHASLVLAGVACGAALWFKEQALPMTAAVPLGLLADATLRRSGSGLWRDLLLYAAGGALAACAYGGLLWANGGLEGYLVFSRTFFRGYVQANEAAVGAGGGPLVHLLRAFLLFLPGRAYFAIAYAMAAGALVLAYRAVRRRLDGSSPEPDLPRLAFLFAAYLVTGMLSVRMGSRFFGHYYLLLLPAVAGLVGIAAHLLVRGSGVEPLPRRIAGLLCLGTLVLEAGPAAPLFQGLDVDAKRPGSLVLQALGWRGALGLAAVALVVSVARRELSLRRPLAGALAFSVGLLVLQSHSMRSPRPFSFSHEPRLLRQLQSRSATGDRLFVWGWAPWIYSLSRLEAASEITLPNIVVNDYSGTRGSPRIEPRYEAILVRDLEERTPRFIVDAAAAGLTLSEDGQLLYRLDLHPGFGLNRLLRERYERAGEFDGCTLYVLKPGA